MYSTLEHDANEVRVFWLNEAWHRRKCVNSVVFLTFIEYGNSGNRVWWQGAWRADIHAMNLQFQTKIENSCVRIDSTCWFIFPFNLGSQMEGASLPAKCNLDRCFVLRNWPETELEWWRSLALPLASIYILSVCWFLWCLCLPTLCLCVYPPWLWLH